MGTVLGDVKKYVGLASENTEFDEDILMFTNGALSILHQNGVGPAEGMSIDNTTEWAAITTDAKLLNLVKQFITMKVKVTFDSSTMSSFVLSSYNDMIAECIWRINAYTDYWKNQQPSN